MATSPYSSTEETTNANRALRLLLGPCKDQLRDVLIHHIPPSTFPHVILQMRSNLPRLTAPQKNLILPRSGMYTGKYDDMDFCLLYILLRNICNIPPHSKGWGNDPDPTDRSLSANIERIRLARNRCVLSSSPALSNVDFKTIWSTVRSAVVDLDSFLNNGNKYEREVDFLRNETMDPAIEVLRKQAENAAKREIVHGLKVIPHFPEKKKFFIPVKLEESETEIKNRKGIGSCLSESLQYLDCFNKSGVHDECRTACLFKKLEYLDCFGLPNKHCSRTTKHENFDIKISDLSVKDIQHAYEMDSDCDCYRMQASIYFEISRLPAISSLEHLLEPAVKNQDHILLYILTYKGTLLSEISAYIQRLSQQARQRYISETIASAIKKRLLQKYRIKRKSICDVRLCLNTDDRDTLVVCVLYRAYFAGDEIFSGLPVIWKSFKQVNQESYLVMQEERRLRSFSDESTDFSRLLPSISSSAAQKLFKSHCNLTMILASRLKSRGFRKNEHTIEQKITITLFCRHKAFRPLGESLFPKTINNFDVDVLEGYCTFGSRNIEIGDEIHCERANQAGIRINKYGSVGGFVKLEDNQLGAITCAHVLYSLDDLKRAADSDGALPAGVPASIGALRECHGTVTKGKFFPNTEKSVDAAVVALDGSYTTDGTFATKVTMKQFLFAGFDLTSLPRFTGKCYKGKVPASDVGLRVIKMGTATGLTSGSFYMNGSHLRMEFIDMMVDETTSSSEVQTSFTMYDQIAVLSFADYPFSDSGDSGSFVYVSHPDKGLICVGMVIAKTTNNLCMVTPIQNILDSLRQKQLYCPLGQPMNTWSGISHNPASDQNNLMTVLKKISSDIQSMKTDIQELKNANAQGRNADTGS